MLKKTFSRYWETVRDILYFCWKGDVPREMRRPRAPISLVARSSLTHLQHLSSLPQSDIASRHQSHFYCLLVWRLRVWLERCDWVCSPEVWLPGDWESSEAPPTSSLHQPPSPDHHHLPPSSLHTYFNMLNTLHTSTRQCWPVCNQSVICCNIIMILSRTSLQASTPLPRLYAAKLSKYWV